MKMGKRILALLLCTVMVLSLAVTGINAAGTANTTADAQQWLTPEYTDSADLGSADQVVSLSGGSWVTVGDEQVQLTNGGDLHASTDMVEVIVVMEAQPLIKRAVVAGMEGEISTYMAQSSTAAIEQSMLRSHASVKTQIAALCDNQADTNGYDYTVVLNGFSMTMPYGKIAEAENLSGVKYIRESRTYTVPEDQSSYDLAMSNSVGMIGSDEVNDMSFAGADGAGTLVAILDTGIAQGHEAFSVVPEDLTKAAYGSESDLQAVMNKATLSSGVTSASDAWISAKIPYAYNYADMTTGGYSTAQPHGTHVAGTVAGNNGKGFKGVAPEAQLLVMKVFNESGSTSDAALNAGIDDAVKLGADSINMSLGSTAGFYYDRKTEDEAYNNCWNAGVNLLIAAGNEYTNALGNQYGNNLGQADTPDNAAVASPSTSYSALSVASVNNCKSRSDFFRIGDETSDTHIPFSQAGNAGTRNNYNVFDELRSYPNNTASFAYAVIGGYGEEKDYTEAGLDAADALSGKIAVVSRGETSFEEKATVAKSHGAKGIIFINNVAGAGSFSPAFNNYVIPSCGVSKESGELLKNAADKSVTFGPSETSRWYGDVTDKTPWVDFFEASDGYQMSSFSSWGPAPTLSIKPEISAPGGNIVSAVIGGGYESYSGTSMATPHMAGVAALVRSYVKNVLGVTEAKKIRTLSENLMMSTAVPAVNSSKAEFSPREQGAGLVNVKNAVTTKAYLTTNADADGVTRPKAELGSNANGTFSFSFNVNNLSDEELRYTLSASSLTEGIVEQDGVKFSNQISTRLDADDFAVSYSGAGVLNGVVTVPAKGTTVVTVSLQLSSAYLSELRQNFVNGNYCEGYVYLQPTDGVDLVIPYLGFVGDWVDAGTVFEGAPDSNYSLAPTRFATANMLGAGLYLGEDAVYEGDKSYNYEQRLAFSPKIAGEQQFLAMQLGIRRNLLDFEVSVTDASGKKVWALDADYLRKCFYYSGTGSVSQPQVLLDGWNGRYLNEETGEYDGEYAPAGQYYLTLSGYVGQQKNKRTTVTYPLWLDGKAPVVSNLQCYVDEADKNQNGEGKFKLAFDVQDDHYVRTIILNDATGTWRLTYSDADFKNHAIQQGSTTKVVMDLDELSQYLAEQGLNPGRVKMTVYDYSQNYSVTYVDIGPQYLSLANATVAVGDTLQMEYRVLPQRLEGDLKLTWSSATPSVAKVDQNGVVTGVSKGTSVITIKAESGLTASAVLTVGDETLPPEKPETPDNNAHVDYPSAETLPDVWNNGVKASKTDELNDRFEADGLWYKVTGADSVQLIRNPNASSEYVASYPNAPAELVIPETVTNSKTGKSYTVTTIGYRAFYPISTMTSVTLPDTIRVIGDQAFMNWASKITSMNLPEGLEEVGANALNGVKVDFKLPSTLKRIGSLAFNATSITSVQLSDEVESVGARAFANCMSLTSANLTVNTQNTEGLYMNCIALTDVTIEPGVTVLPQNGFYNCQALTGVVLPDSVTEIGKGTFQGSKIQSLDFLNTGYVTTIGGFAFAGTPVKDIVIPDSVTYVGKQQFRFCPGVRSISFGKNVAYVGHGVMSMFFMDPSVTQVIPEVGSATAGAAVRRSGYVGAMTKDGVGFDVYCGTAFMQDGFSYMPISATEVQVTGYDESVIGGVVTIPETVTCEGDEVTYTVTSIADNLFKQKYSITEVHLPDTITTVGQRAFDQMHELSYINIPKNLESLTGDQAFGYGGWDPLVEHEAWKVDTLYVPATLKTWAQSAFSGNQYTKLVLEDGLEMIGTYSFSANLNLNEVVMPSTLKYLKEYAFAGCTALEDVALPEGLVYIGDKVFQGDSLNNVSLPDSVKYVGTQAFETVKTDSSSGNAQTVYTGPAEIKLGSGVTGLGWNAFYKDAKLTAVLGSQQNLLVERCDFAETPAVVWDGKTSIPAGDYSIVPADTIRTVRGNVRIDGTLIIEYGAFVAVPDGSTLTIGMGADVDTDKILRPRVPDVPVPPSIPTISTTKPAADNSTNRFTDVLNPGSFYYDAVYWAAENGITTGYTATTFAPEVLCTRAQIVTFLWRAAGSPEPANSNNPFSDVRQSDYFYKAVLWAVEKNITKGTGTGTFSPNTVCSRAEVVTFLWRYSDCPETTDAAAFTDVAASAYYAKAVAWATANNITKGVSAGRFAPANSCSRGEIVTFLYRCLNK